MQANGDALRGQQPVQAIDQDAPLLLERFAQPMLVAGILLRDTGHPYHMPHAMLAVHVPLQQPQQPGQIEDVGLRPARAPLTSILDQSTT